MDKNIIKSINDNNMDMLLKTTYANLKKINELCNNYIQHCKNIKDEQNCVIDITTVYSTKLLHSFLLKYKKTNNLLNELSLFP